MQLHRLMVWTDLYAPALAVAAAFEASRTLTKHLASILSDYVPTPRFLTLAHKAKLLSQRTHTDVLLRLVAELTRGKLRVLSGSLVLVLGLTHQDLVALGLRLAQRLPRVVPTVGDRGLRYRAELLVDLLEHRYQLMIVRARTHQILSHDQAVSGVHDRLAVVAELRSALALHHLRLRLLGLQMLPVLLLEPVERVSDRLAQDLTIPKVIRQSARCWIVLAFCRLYILLQRLDLALHAPQQTLETLTMKALTARRLHRHLRPVHRVQHRIDQARVPRHLHHLSKHSTHRLAVVAPKTPQRIVIRYPLAREPDQRHVLSARALQSPSTAYAMHVAIQPHLQQQIPSVLRSTLDARWAGEAQRFQIHGVDKLPQEPCWMLRTDPVLQTRWKHLDLRVVCP